LQKVSLSLCVEACCQLQPTGSLLTQQLNQQF